MSVYKQYRNKAVKWMDSGTTRIGNYVVLIPDLIYCYFKLLFHKHVSGDFKLKLALAVIYYISPIDILPEMFLGIFGYVEDISILAWMFNEMFNKTTSREIFQIWPGTNMMFEQLKITFFKIDDVIGSGLWRKIRKMF